jgi:hypothetical protein
MDWMTFGVVQRYIKERTKFVSSCEELCDHLRIDLKSLASSVPALLSQSLIPNTTIPVCPRINIDGQLMDDGQQKQAL